MQKFVFYVLFISLIPTSLSSQDGFYAGGGLLFLNASEEVVSGDGRYDFTASASFTDSKATLPQAFPNIGYGGYIGYKHIFGKDPDKVRFWAGMELSFNSQKLDIMHKADTLSFHTKVDYNFDHLSDWVSNTKNYLPMQMFSGSFPKGSATPIL